MATLHPPAVPDPRQLHGGHLLRRLVVQAWARRPPGIVPRPRRGGGIHVRPPARPVVGGVVQPGRPATPLHPHLVDRRVDPHSGGTARGAGEDDPGGRPDGPPAPDLRARRRGSTGGGRARRMARGELHRPQAGGAARREGGQPQLRPREDLGRAVRHLRRGPCPPARLPAPADGLLRGSGAGLRPDPSVLPERRRPGRPQRLPAASHLLRPDLPRQERSGKRVLLRNERPVSACRDRGRRRVRREERGRGLRHLDRDPPAGLEVRVLPLHPGRRPGAVQPASVLPPAVPVGPRVDRGTLLG